MFVRVTPFKMKADSRDAATELVHQLKDKIMGMDGMQQFINVMNEDGSGYIIAVVDSEESSNANADNVKALWGQFADHLEAMPVPVGYDTVVNWSN